MNYLSPPPIIKKPNSANMKWKIAKKMIKIGPQKNEDSSMKSMFKDLGKKGRLSDVISVLGKVSEL